LIYICFYNCKILSFELENNLLLQLLLLFWAGFCELQSVGIFEKSLTVSKLGHHLCSKSGKNEVKMHFFEKNKNNFFPNFFLPKGPKRVTGCILKRKFRHFLYFLYSLSASKK
jgi:hypothetical protein